MYAEDTRHLRFIPDVLNKETCKRHKAEKGDPCWWWIASSGNVLDAICNARARRAGMNAPIKPSSLRKKGPETA